MGLASVLPRQTWLRGPSDGISQSDSQGRWGQLSPCTVSVVCVSVSLCVCLCVLCVCVFVCFGVGSPPLRLRFPTPCRAQVLLYEVNDDFTDMLLGMAPWDGGVVWLCVCVVACVWLCLCVVVCVCVCVVVCVWLCVCVCVCVWLCVSVSLCLCVLCVCVCFGVGSPPLRFPTPCRAQVLLYEVNDDFTDMLLGMAPWDGGVVWLCVCVCGFVWLCVCGCVCVCVVVCVWFCVVVCVWLCVCVVVCVCVCGCVCVWLCVSVSLCVVCVCVCVLVWVLLPCGSPRLVVLRCYSLR